LIGNSYYNILFVILQSQQDIKLSIAKKKLKYGIGIWIRIQHYSFNSQKPEQLSHQRQKKSKGITGFLGDIIFESDDTETKIDVAFAEKHNLERKTSGEIRLRLSISSKLKNDFNHHSPTIPTWI
jgi:hypothetical protein